MNLWSKGWKRPENGKGYGLGYLREIELLDGTCMIFRGNTVMLASDEKGKHLYFFRRDLNPPERVSVHPADEKALFKGFKSFHWGDAPNRAIAVQHLVPPSGEVIPKGPAVRIDYTAKKDGQLAEYTHKHKSPYPIVAIDKDGKQLFYIGGIYRVRGEGIVG